MSPEGGGVSLRHVGVTAVTLDGGAVDGSMAGAGGAFLAYALAELLHLGSRSLGGAASG
jgi:hypothetical protein